MAEAALSIPSSLAAMLSPAPADSGPTAGAGQTVDPFAALFATVASVPAAETPVISVKAQPFAMPAILTTPPAASAVVTNALPAVAKALLPATGEEIDSEEETDTDAADEDPLAAAIASGATAVLAFAPAIVAAPQAQAPVPTLTPTPTQASTPTPTPASVAARAAAPPIPSTAPAPAPIAIDGPQVMPAPSPTIGVAFPAHRPVKSLPQPLIVEAALPDAGNAALDPTSPQAPSPAQQVAVAQDKSAATPLSPETIKPDTIEPDTIKTVIASLQQSDRTAAQASLVATPAPSSAGDAATNAAHPINATKAQQPPPQTPVQQAVQVAAPVRRGSDEVAAPRRSASETRRRLEPAVADSAPVGLAQRAGDNGARPIDAPATVAANGDTIVEQTLSIARDGAWLDTLARDIANSAGTGADLHFKLNPQNLGSLTVAIAQSQDGASIRLTADTHETRNILLDAQPKLIAEARAQGLKVSDTHVDLSNRQDAPNQDASRWTQGSGGQNGGAQNGQNRQSSTAHQPFVSNLARKSDAESESPSSDSDALYA
jgi:flagellar hook-length control protein FliK